MRLGCGNRNGQNRIIDPLGWQRWLLTEARRPALEVVAEIFRRTNMGEGAGQLPLLRQRRFAPQLL
ncbi:hypothetical protein KCP71_24235 [Salmonella enterica subsp. enterica]|nr:hypothetical protein KCP71_24235 [Salmonella enterica subsp. enterica]